MCVSVLLLICRFSRVFPSYPQCAFLGENILDFDVGNSDGGDGRSRRRVIPEGQVVRGEEDGETRGGGS